MTQSLIYLRKGLLKEARALCVNGAFVRQCISLSIEYIKELCNSGASQETIMEELDVYTEGFYATESPSKMVRVHLQFPIMIHDLSYTEPPSAHIFM